MTTSRPVEVTFLIADLSGFTALTEAHGDAQAMGVALESLGSVVGKA